MRNPDGVNAWLDFWVICLDARAHLFYSSLDGRRWLSETRLEGSHSQSSAPPARSEEARWRSRGQAAPRTWR